MFRAPISSSSSGESDPKSEDSEESDIWLSLLKDYPIMLVLVFLLVEKSLESSMVT